MSKSITKNQVEWEALITPQSALLYSKNGVSIGLICMLLKGQGYNEESFKTNTSNSTTKIRWNLKFLSDVFFWNVWNYDAVH